MNRSGGGRCLRGAGGAGAAGDGRRVGASPSELGESVGPPSNLLAHHLRVLEEAGLITRGRSEADRRPEKRALVVEEAA